VLSICKCTTHEIRAYTVATDPLPRLSGTRLSSWRDLRLRYVVALGESNTHLHTLHGRDGPRVLIPLCVVVQALQKDYYTVDLGIRRCDVFSTSTSRCLIT